jgi:hypothetical protein
MTKALANMKLYEGIYIRSKIVKGNNRTLVGSANSTQARYNSQKKKKKKKKKKETLTEK